MVVPQTSRSVIICVAWVFISLLALCFFTSSNMPVLAAEVPGTSSKHLSVSQQSTPVQHIEHNIPDYKFISRINSALDPYGVQFNIVGFGGFTSNVAGGMDSPNSNNAEALFFNIDVDMAKLAGIEGGKVHFQWGQYLLRNNIFGWDREIGDMTLAYQHPHLYRSYALQMLTYEQLLLDNSLSIEVGRTNMIRYFTPNICNSILTCFSNIWIYNINICPITTSHWGGVVTYNVDDKWTLRFAGTETNPDEVKTHGLSWGTERALGAAGLMQVAYSDNSSFYDNYYSLLGYYNAAPQPDPFLNGGKTPNGVTKPLRFNSHYAGVMAQFSQDIWKENEKNGRSLTLYGTAGSGFESYDAAAQDVITGVTLKSLVPGIPEDQIGIQFHWSRVGKQQYKAFREYGSRTKRSTFILGINTQFQIIPGMLFQPSFQYAFNPNNYYQTNSRKTPKNAVVLGMMMLIDFSKLF